MAWVSCPCLYPNLDHRGHTEVPRSLLLSLCRVPVSFLNWVMVDLVEGLLPASHCAEYLLVLTTAP